MYKQRRRKGLWNILKYDGNGYPELVECSSCLARFREDSYYCSVCGAEMKTPSLEDELWTLTVTIEGMHNRRMTAEQGMDAVKHHKGLRSRVIRHLDTKVQNINEMPENMRDAAFKQWIFIAAARRGVAPCSIDPDDLPEATFYTVNGHPYVDVEAPSVYHMSRRSANERILDFIKERDGVSIKVEGHHYADREGWMTLEEMVSKYFGVHRLKTSFETDHYYVIVSKTNDLFGVLSYGDTLEEILINTKYWDHTTVFYDSTMYYLVEEIPRNEVFDGLLSDHRLQLLSEIAGPDLEHVLDQEYGEVFMDFLYDTLEDDMDKIIEVLERMEASQHDPLIVDFFDSHGVGMTFNYDLGEEVNAMLNFNFLVATADDEPQEELEYIEVGSVNSGHDIDYEPTILSGTLERFVLNMQQAHYYMDDNGTVFFSVS